MHRQRELRTRALRQPGSARERRTRSIAEETGAAKIAELERQIAHLSAYTGTVAHQLKNSVFLILGYADLLNDAYQTMTNDEWRDCILSITESVTKMQTIILGLLQADGEIQPLDMGAIVAEAQRRLTHLINRHQAEMIVPAAWPAALGCRDWVEEVWVNYLSNALKYGGSPPRVELGGDTQTNGMARFWIRDNGHGLTAEQQARVFIKGTRLQPASVEGHGRGLSIVQDYIRRLGGQVGVESGVGQGSVFFFTLPGVTRSP